jgi:hypothetical protein
VDGDKYPTGLPDAAYVPFIRLKCREIENLYVTDEVMAALDLDWDTACSKIAEKAGNYGEKKQALEATRNIDRRNGDLKPIIHQLAEILDPKGLLWTVRLGKVLGQGPPTGMLGDFVGSEVGAAVWPGEPPPTA